MTGRRYDFRGFESDCLAHGNQACSDKAHRLPKPLAWRQVAEIGPFHLPGFQGDDAKFHAVIGET